VSHPCILTSWTRDRGRHRTDVAPVSRASTERWAGRWVVGRWTQKKKEPPCYSLSPSGNETSVFPVSATEHRPSYQFFATARSRTRSPLRTSGWSDLYPGFNSYQNLLFWSLGSGRFRTARNRRLHFRFVGSWQQDLRERILSLS